LYFAIGWAVINFAGSDNLIQHNLKGTLLTRMLLVKELKIKFLGFHNVWQNLRQLQG